MYIITQYRVVHKNKLIRYPKKLNIKTNNVDLEVRKERNKLLKRYGIKNIKAGQIIKRKNGIISEVHEVTWQEEYENNLEVYPTYIDLRKKRK